LNVNENLFICLNKIVILSLFLASTNSSSSFVSSLSLIFGVTICSSVEASIALEGSNLSVLGSSALYQLLLSYLFIWFVYLTALSDLSIGLSVL
jgi:hypothetical protein